MMERRNIFLHGLSLTLRRFPALVWTYVFNLALALLFSISFHRQIASLLSHSLAAQRLTSGFDLGTIGEVSLHLHEGPVGDSGGIAGHASIPVFLIVYFLLVPGTLYCYQTATPARLGTLLQQGLLYFWRFVRITLLTLIVCGLILGPLTFCQDKWADYIDDHLVGRRAFLCILAGYIIIFFIASILRLYFDLVEVYTVQLGLQIRENGKPDRRVRKTLLPALRALRRNFWRAYSTFIALAVLGLAAVFFTARTAMHSLAQPRVWPMFLLAQTGLFLMLATRFWQRGAETTLSLDFPIVEEEEAPYNGPSFVTPTYPPLSVVLKSTVPEHHDRVTDPIPAPEPASPSLAEPDPGIYRPETPPKTPPEDAS